MWFFSKDHIRNHGTGKYAGKSKRLRLSQFSVRQKLGPPIFPVDEGCHEFQWSQLLVGIPSGCEFIHRLRHDELYSLRHNTKIS